MRRRALIVVGAVLALLVLSAGPSLAQALSAPGTDPVAARLAEWGRDHGLGPVVTWLEARQYELSPPPAGGALVGGIPTNPGADAGAGSAGGGLPAPAPVPAAPGLSPLPGEGVWQTVVSGPTGGAAVRVAYLRPDVVHTSVLAGVMWLDPLEVAGRLHPGTEDPGGTWATPSAVTPTLQRSVAAVFNGGFRLQGDSHGGWYSEGREARSLVPGAASLVLRRDGSADVGAWGTEVRMGPDVASVRQNLVPLVDQGEVTPTCATGGPAEWGSTVGQAAFIARSGFGVSASGAEVYVGGPALSVCSLGTILRSAGVVRGMELDINPNWVSGAYFGSRPDAPPQASRLFPDEKVSAEHYLQPSSRDFFAWYLRPQP